MDEITKATAKGIESLFDYGIAVTVLVLVGVGGGFLFRYLLNRCDERFDASLVRQQSITDKMADVVDRNTEAHTKSLSLMTTVADAITEIRSDIRKAME